MNLVFSSLLLVSVIVSIAGATAGVLLAGVREISRRIVPLSGAVLLVLSLFWVLPELAETYGWSSGPALMLAGFGILWLLDRFVYPVCPACSHDHDHDACTTRLHGFAAPLIGAAMLHSLFDGWTLSMAASGLHGGTPLAASVLIHKIPESIACGVILKSALASRQAAFGWAITIQATTLAGAMLGLWLAPALGSEWLGVLLALGGGTFLYLGVHAVHGEWRRRLTERTVRIS